MYVLKLFRVTAGNVHCCQIRSKETLRIMYPKYPALNMIQRTHLRCGSFGSIIRFWILVKKRNIRFRIKIRIWILVKKPPLTKTTSWELKLYHNYIVESGNSDCKSFRSKLFRTDFTLYTINQKPHSHVWFEMTSNFNDYCKLVPMWRGKHSITRKCNDATQVTLDWTEKILVIKRHK